MHSKIYGEGPPLLILHGLLGMGDNWRTLGKKWSDKKCQVHLLDIRNHGKSFHRKKINHSIISKDLCNYISYYKLTKVNLLGHSMGGKSIMHFALYHPENTKNIIIADISPKAYEGNKEIFRVLKNLPINNIERRSKLNNLLEINIMDPSIRTLISKNIYRNKDGRFSFISSIPGIEKHYTQLLSEQKTIKKPYEGPTLFLRSELSEYIDEEDIPFIKALFPRANIITIAKASHCLHQDQPKEVYKQVVKFLNI